MNRGMIAAGPGLDEYETPKWLFDALDAEFAFTHDGAASETNTRCRSYSDASHTIGLHWADQAVFCNPPYSNIEPFVTAALARKAQLSVLLLPVRTDSDWFHRLVHAPRVELRWLRKRIRFCLDGKSQDSPRFTSFLAIVR